MLIFALYIYLLCAFHCISFSGNMVNECHRRKRPRPSFDNHATCPQCRLAAELCQLDASQPCQVWEGWSSRVWKKLGRSLIDTRARAVQRGTLHWMSGFPHLNKWLGQPASAASSEPGSEASSVRGYILDNASGRNLGCLGGFLR